MTWSIARRTICHKNTTLRVSLIRQPDRVRMDMDPIHDDPPERSLELRSLLRSHDLVSHSDDACVPLLAADIGRSGRSGRDGHAGRVVEDCSSLEGSGSRGGCEDGGGERARGDGTGDEVGDRVGVEFADGGEERWRDVRWRADEANDAAGAGQTKGLSLYSRAEFEREA